MKKIFALICFVTLSASVFAQDAVVSDANAEVRKVGSFKGVRVSSGIELLLKQGNEEAVAVSAIDNEYRERIKTVVEDGILKIYFDHKDWHQWKTSNKKLKAYVSIKTIEKLQASAGASVNIDGVLKADKLVVGASSGSVLKGNIEANDLDLDGSSGSVVHLTGKAQKCKVDASSGSNLHAYDLVVDNCEADASSGSMIEITINKEMSAEASSGADIKYKGNGVLRSVSTGSGGSIKKRA